jgi:hypothetical protein
MPIPDLDCVTQRIGARTFALKARYDQARRISGDTLSEVAHYVDPAGSNFRGVYLHDHPDGNAYGTVH